MMTLLCSFCRRPSVVESEWLLFSTAFFNARCSSTVLQTVPQVETECRQAGVGR